MNVRVFYKGNGEVAVFTPAPNARRKDEADQDFLERVSNGCMTGSSFEGAEHEDIDASTLPDRKDRSKWRGSKGQGVRVEASVIPPSLLADDN